MHEINSVDIQRFWSKVTKDSDNILHWPELSVCWEWNAGKFSQGYGAFWLNGKTEKAHKVSWVINYNNIPTIQVCHHCDNPSCVRPSHLFLGTQEDNMKDKVNKGRGYKFYGEKHGNARLSEFDVREIIKLYTKDNYTMQLIAVKYGITFQHVSDIINKKSWRHLHV